MKLPTIWIVAGFAAGICAATFYPVRPGICIGVATAAILLGGIFLWQDYLRAAGVAALLSWASLGAASLAIERATVPTNQVTRLLSAGRLDTTEPLRWRGRPGGQNLIGTASPAIFSCPKMRRPYRPLRTMTRSSCG